LHVTFCTSPWHHIWCAPLAESLERASHYSHKGGLVDLLTVLASIDDITWHDSVVQSDIMNFGPVQSARLLTTHTHTHKIHKKIHKVKGYSCTTKHQSLTFSTTQIAANCCKNQVTPPPPPPSTPSLPSTLALL